MKNKVEIAKDLLNRNINGFNRNIDEFSKFLAKNYTRKELLNSKQLECCPLCGGEVKIHKTNLENDKIIYSTECTKCHVGGECFYSEELAIFSHNSDSWFFDGIEL